MFFIAVISHQFSVSTVFSTSNTKYQYPPPNPMRSSVHLLFIQSFSFASFADQFLYLLIISYHICNLVWKVTQNFFLILSVLSLFKKTSRHFSPKKRIVAILRILSFRAQIFYFITLSTCHVTCNKLFSNSIEISCPNTQPLYEVRVHIIASSMTLSDSSS